MIGDKTLTMVLRNSPSFDPGERRWRAEFHRPLVSEGRDLCDHNLQVENDL
jgi:hypothetical protein